MCGINGIFAYHTAANAVDPRELERTRDHMRARGPDGAGTWVSTDGRIGLAHRRLSIIDLSSAGAQPMASADGSLVVTFNGEIYNYRELRRALEAKGHLFHSRSDTEVLLHLYADKGESMVGDLRGMFAFAIWDVNRQALFLARDPYGIKPLYYASDGRTFRFASQVKALLSGGAISREPEPAGTIGFYLWGSVPEPFTTHQAIRGLPAGCTMLVDRLGASEPRRFHSIAKVYRDADEGSSSADYGAALPVIRAALLDSVRHHLVADVPVGAFLSAGIDSGALVGLMRDAGQHEIQTITLGFEEFDGRLDDETPLAQEVARHYGTRHSTRIVTRAEFEQSLPAILEAMDQPTIDGVNTWFVAKAARELGLKVAISGLGGDELFGGYPSFRDIPRWLRLLSVPSRIPGLGRAVRWVGQRVGSMAGLNPKAAGLLELGGTYPGAYLLRRGLFMPWELDRIADADFVNIGMRRLEPLRQVSEVLGDRPISAHASVATLESSLYMRNQLLRDTDWASMAHSLEVRVPLVDSVLLQEVASPAARLGLTGKHLLAEAPSRPLPAAVVGRCKTGFTTPVATWTSAIDGKGSSVPWARIWASQVFSRSMDDDPTRALPRTGADAAWSASS